MKLVQAQAVEWYVRLNESTVSAATRSQWEVWLAADPQHAQTWARLEQLQQRLAQAPATVAAPTLERAREQRRAALKMLALLLGGGAEKLDELVVLPILAGDETFPEPSFAAYTSVTSEVFGGSAVLEVREKREE